MSSRPSRGAARLAAILDALPDALLLVNANGTVVNANSIALEVFETPGTALVGRGLLDLLPAFDSKRIPGSMRRPDEQVEGRQPPTRMMARRTNGDAFPVEVTSANLADGRTPYESSFEAAYADHGNSYTGNELLMLVVRDLTGTLDTEAELARQQRQTEMILRAAAEGVIGTDTEGRVVLVNPAAATILGYRASDLGGQELHPLVHHSRPDGSPLPYDETPLADTLRSGRKHRVRNQVLWAKDGRAVPVDITTAPVRDGDQLVGAVLTFTDRRPLDSLTARHEQLLAVVDDALRGPLEELRRELGGLAADPAGQLWPEANQVLHHLSAGYTRMTTLVDNVLGFQRLETGRDKLEPRQVALDAVVSAGVEGAIELIGPGRAQFAVHAPPVQAVVDPERLALALAHLIADVAGVDATGNAVTPGGGSGDSTIVVAAAKRGGEEPVARIEVRGPYGGGSPVHQPVVRGVVRLHGGVLQTHELPGASGGSAFVLEVPLGEVDESLTPPPPATADKPEAEPELADGGEPEAPRAGQEDAGHPDAGREDAGHPDAGAARTDLVPAPPTGRRARRALGAPTGEGAEADATGLIPEQAAPGTGRRGRRAKPAPAGEGTPDAPRRRTPFALPPADADRSPAPPQPPAELHPGYPVPGAPVPPQGLATPAPGQPPHPQPGTPAHPDAPATPAPPGAPGAHADPGPHADPEAPHPPGAPATPGAHAHPDAPADPGAATRPGPRTDPAAQADPSAPPHPAHAGQGAPAHPGAEPPGADRPTGRRRKPTPPEPSGPAHLAGEHGAPPQESGAAPTPEHATPAPHTAAQHAHAPAPPEPHAAPAPHAAGAPHAASAPHGRAPHAPEPPAQQPPSAPHPPADHGSAHPEPTAADAVHGQPARSDARAASLRESPHSGVAGSPILGGEGQPARPGPSRAGGPPAHRAPEQPGDHPGDHAPGEGSLGHGFSVRTLGQGLPYARSAGAAPTPAPGTPAAPPAAPPVPPSSSQPPGTGGSEPAATPAQGSPATPPGGTGRRRKLATPPAEGRRGPAARPDPAPAHAQPPAHQPGQSPAPEHSEQPGRPGDAAQPPHPGRQFAIGAPEAGADEGPEPLDGPNGAVEVRDERAATPPHPIDVDDELPPEPLDNPRRLLVWPEPDVSTQQALTDRGYRPVLVHSREEVDAQMAAYPAALFVDPLTGPITRTALQSLRQAAVAAEVPVLVTAGLGQASREAAYGADPAVLLKALAPRDSEQHPPRVLLVEEHSVIAEAFTASLERRGMQVFHTPTDSEAATLAAEVRPNLVVMDLRQIRRRRAGVIDWLRVNGLLNRTPFVVYTSAVMDAAEQALLTSGDTVLFLAERSTSAEVQRRIVDLLAKIGAN